MLRGRPSRREIDRIASSCPRIRRHRSLSLSSIYLLVLVGPLAERVYGRTGMLIRHLMGGLWASLGSACWSSLRTVSPTTDLLGGQPSLNPIVSVGASGALMALCGAMLMAGLWQLDGPQDAAERSPAKASYSGVLLEVIGINFVMKFAARGVDQAVHIGGLIAGLFLGARTRGDPITPTQEEAMA